MKSKQLRTGLQQLGEEARFRCSPHRWRLVVVGCRRLLQFEVVLHRLKSEYNVDAKLEPSRYRLARWITCEDPVILKRFIDANSHRVAHDVVEAPAFLATHPAELEVAAGAIRKSSSTPCASTQGGVCEGGVEYSRLVRGAHHPVVGCAQRKNSSTGAAFKAKQPEYRTNA